MCKFWSVQLKWKQKFLRFQSFLPTATSNYVFSPSFNVKPKPREKISIRLILKLNDVCRFSSRFNCVNCVPSKMRFLSECNSSSYFHPKNPKKTKHGAVYISLTLPASALRCRFLLLRLLSQEVTNKNLWTQKMFFFLLLSGSFFRLFRLKMSL